MDIKRFKELIENQDYEVAPYSGRGMYGKYCPSITISLGSLPGLVAAVIAKATIEEQPDLTDFFEGACLDSMGLDVVMYFPDWSKEKEEEENADDKDL